MGKEWGADVEGLGGGKGSRMEREGRVENGGLGGGGCRVGKRVKPDKG